MTSVFDWQADTVALVVSLSTPQPRTEERAYKIERTTCKTMPLDVHWASDNPTQLFSEFKYGLGPNLRPW